MEICIGLFFTFVSLLVISSTTAKDDEQNLATQMATGVQEQEHDNGYKEVEDVETGGKKVSADEMHVFPISQATILFQALLCLASIYYAMLLTNWGKPTILDNTAVFFDKNG